ncbi:MAG TPA: hypothetical protein VND96_19220 [Candidatus Micrarchaeaceae archaeon]|nr:hypothetical protein [Candidatus Micrarchaeaceae archaeon]
MSTSIVAEGLDVDEHGHVLVKLSDTPPDQWMEAFREYWGRPETIGGASVKKEAFSHFSDMTIVFRGVDVDGFVEHCKTFTQDAVKYANEETQRFEAERDARIRAQAGTAGRDQKHIEAERTKARKVRFE